MTIGFGDSDSVNGVCVVRVSSVTSPISFVDSQYISGGITYHNCRLLDI